MADEPRVLLEGEFASMGSSWTEYLCIGTTEGGIELSSRGYEVLAELSEFEVETEDGDVDYEVPKEINGVPVHGVQDDMVVGGELMESGDSDSVMLLPGEVDKAREWMKETGWAAKDGAKGAWKEICKALGVAKAPPL